MTRSKADGGFGFKELQAFNLALLGKMAARVMAEPTALWVRVLRGIYFPQSDFLGAVKGGHPSWAWTSLLAGRDAVRAGTVWAVGDGRTIRPFSDAWLSGGPIIRLGQQPITAHQATMLLENWIDPQSRSWNEAAVREAVSKVEAIQILQVPIPLNPRPDALRWPFERQGRVTARSAYHYIHQQREGEVGRAQGPQVGQQHQQNVWEAIWGSKLLPKIKVFAWKLCSRALAIGDELAKRGM